MSSGSGILRILTGFTVERRVVWVPVGLAVGPPVCVESPEDCCPSGSGSGVGCCDANDVLYALLYTEDDCSCLVACVILVYDDALDAWFSTQDVAQLCGAAGLFLRLRCRDAVWSLDVVEGASGDDVVLEGDVDQSEVLCDPFYLAGHFDDSTDDVVCGGTFAYVVTESDCTGGGGGVVTGCCPEGVPATLYATFGGSLASLGTVTLTHSGGMSGQWEGAAAGACGEVTMTFLCLGIGSELWSLGVIGGTQFDIPGLEAASCDPFEWSASGTSTGTCAGAATVSVSATAP